MRALFLSAKRNCTNIYNYHGQAKPTCTVAPPARSTTAGPTPQLPTLQALPPPLKTSLDPSHGEALLHSRIWQAETAGVGPLGSTCRLRTRASDSSYTSFTQFSSVASVEASSDLGSWAGTNHGWP